MLLIFLSHIGIRYTDGYPVVFFFMLSGFVVCKLYNKKIMDTNIKSIMNFTKNKIKKVYLVHIITLMISIPMRLKFIILEPIISMFAIIAHLTLLQSVVINNIAVN